MADGYVGEIFSSIQGEGLYVGVRQLFLRMAGCIWNCVYCDTRRFRDFRPANCMVEIKPGSGRFRPVKNPLSAESVFEHLEGLWTEDVHSVSITGGEPLLSANFIADVARICGRNGLKTYLETNGCSSDAMEIVLPHIDIAAIDIKLPDHRAVPETGWKRIFEEEMKCIDMAARRSVDVFAKVVVLASSSDRDLANVFSRLARLNVPLVLQPVTGTGRVKPPPFERLCRISETAVRAGIREIAIIPQVHRLMGVR
ncbi:MAG: 7-carboxy-7-deazaguanine synthase QueE [Candidatus Hadarchaeales archaeon]